MLNAVHLNQGNDVTFFFPVMKWYWALTIQKVLSETYYQSTFLYTDTCDSAPDAMYVFSEYPSDIYNAAYEERDGNMYQCGSNVMPRQKGCCNRCLDAEFCHGYHSFFLHSVKNEEIVDAPPVTVLGQSYCLLMPNSGTKSFDAIYYLVGTTCHDGHTICNANGTLTVYEEDACQGSSTAYNSGETILLQQYNTSFTHQVVLISTGDTTAIWTTGLPSYLFVSLLSYPLEWIQLFCYILSLLGATIQAVLYFKVYVDSKRVRDLLLSIAQCVWLIYMILECVYVYVPFPNFDAIFIVDQFLGMTYNIVTLFNVVVSGNTLIAFSFLDLTAVQMYTFLGMIHIGLAWAQYAQYFLYKDALVTFYILVFSPYWTFFVYLFDLLPLALVTVKITTSFKRKNQKKVPVSAQVWDLLLKEWQFTSLVFCQLLNTLGFTVVTALRKTELFQNDWNWEATRGLVASMMFVHSLLNMLLDRALVKLHEKTINAVEVMFMEGVVNRAPQTDPIDSRIAHTTTMHTASMTVARRE